CSAVLVSFLFVTASISALLSSFLRILGFHPTLHSFPTRRSSDLSEALVHKSSEKRWFQEMICEDGKCYIPKVWLQSKLESFFGKDRKSTRLNSITFRSRMPSSA